MGTDFLNANGHRSFWYFTLARWAVIPFSLLGGYFCYRWARELYGTISGLTALVLWCFSPGVLGNASLITPDAGAAALGVVAGYYFWRWLRDPRWSRVFVAGLTLGLAELTKVTWIILFALWPLSWLVWNRIGRNMPLQVASSASAKQPTSMPQAFFQIATIMLFGLYILNLGYGFEASFRRLGEFKFISRTLGGTDAHDNPGNRFADSWLREFPVPIPENYFRGLDVQKYDFEKGKWSYLRGEQRLGGWWYYYLYGLAIKEPLGTWLLVLIAVAVAVQRMVRKSSAEYSVAWRDGLVLLLPAAAVLIVVSSQTGFNRYVRYVLPCYPFIFIWTSQAAHWIRSRNASPLVLLRSIAVFGCLIWSISSSMAVYPHSLSYFNELAGGPLNGHLHLLDANIDWGQDLLNLKRSLDAHPDARPLKLAYFGDELVDPKIASIDFEPARPSRHSAGTPEPFRPAEGWYAVSVNRMHDYRHNGNEQAEFGVFLHLQPVAHAGYSIYVYQVGNKKPTESLDVLR